MRVLLDKNYSHVLCTFFFDENDTRVLLDKNHNAHFKQVFSYAYFMRVLLDKIIFAFVGSA